jgi:hypothetical protein
MDTEYIDEDVYKVYEWESDTDAMEQLLDGNERYYYTAIRRVTLDYMRSQVNRVVRQYLALAATLYSDRIRT